jgi:DNA-binding LytR/AlgR family response regulator
MNRPADHATVATALIADDEPLLREHLATQLARLWPELEVVAQARNGPEALALFDDHEPTVCFLDVHMPALNGIQVAQQLKGRTQIVFLTAFDRYAVPAFDQGAVDYLLKPLDAARLGETLERLKQRLTLADAARDAAGLAALEPLLERIAGQIGGAGEPGAGLPARRAWLQWIKASVGSTLKLIPVDEVVYLRSDEKYTLVAWPGGEALIRKTIRELADELDPAQFVQIHRSTIVALRHVSHVVRGANETADVHLRGRSEVLPVSRSWLHLFRQM